MPQRTTRYLSIEYLPTDALKPDPRNPRRHSERQIKQLARSIEAAGFNVPILVDASNHVLAGHGRLLALCKLGWKEAPIIRLEHLTDAQARAFAIADNRLAECAEWDDQLLAECLNDLASMDLDFSLEVTGFTMAEIDLRIESLSAPQEPEADPADVLPNETDAPSISRPGDVWQLHRHRLICGNALDTASFDALMLGERAHIVFTDPPYNVRIEGHVSGKGRIHHREFAMASGEMDEPEFIAFLTEATRLLALNSHPGSVHFVCMDWRHQFEILTAGRATYSRLLNLCVWCKINGGMGSLYRSQHELVFVFRHGTSPHRNNVELGRFGRNRTNVWQYAGVNGFSRNREEGDLSALHPTVKPVQMVADALLDCSARGDIVLDPFLGSGSTLIAAERVGRFCYGIEIDPVYVDTAIRRWQQHSGECAIHSQTGRRFDDLAVENVHD